MFIWLLSLIPAKPHLIHWIEVMAMAKPTAPVTVCNHFHDNEKATRCQVLTALTAQLLQQGTLSVYNVDGSTGLSSSNSQNREEMKT